jgi:hypothetical protein
MQLCWCQLLQLGERWAYGRCQVKKSYLDLGPCRGRASSRVHHRHHPLSPATRSSCGSRRTWEGAQPRPEPSVAIKTNPNQIDIPSKCKENHLVEQTLRFIDSFYISSPYLRFDDDQLDNQQRMKGMDTSTWGFWRSRKEVIASFHLSESAPAFQELPWDKTSRHDAGDITSVIPCVTKTLIILDSP